MEFKKKVLKKSLVSIVTLSMIMGPMVTTSLAADLSDIDNHWAANQIKRLVDRGTISGYNDGTFKPNNYITRAEFISLINKAYNYQAVNDINYKDVSSKDWYYEDLRKAKAQGYILGYKDNTMRPNSNITRQEVAVIMAKLYNLQVSDNIQTIDKFKDKNKISSWAKDAISCVVNCSYMNGYPDGTFAPDKNITRAEASTILYKIVNKNSSGGLIKEERSVTREVSSSSSDERTIDRGDVTIKEKGYTLKNKEIKGDLIISSDVADGNVYIENVIVKGTTKIYGGGENSVYIDDSELGNVIVEKSNDKIRLVAEGNSNIGKVQLKSGGILEEKNLKKSGFDDVEITDKVKDTKIVFKGEFDEIEAYASRSNINIEEGKIYKLDVKDTSKDLKVGVSSDAKVSKLILDAKADITGKGTISNATVNASDVRFEYKPSNIDGTKKDYIKYDNISSSGTKTSSGDVVAPNVDSVSVGSIKNNSAYLFVKTNEVGTIYWCVLPSLDLLPSKDSIIAGTSGVAKGYELYSTANQLQAINISGLSKDTYYKVYVVAKDNANNKSDIKVSSEFKTTNRDEIPPIITFNPEKGATNIDIADQIKIIFNESVRKLDNTDINDIDLKQIIKFKKTDMNGEAVPYTATIDNAKKVITIIPSDKLANNQKYYISIEAQLEDSSDNTIAASNSTFTTIVNTVEEKVTDTPKVTDNSEVTADTKTLTGTCEKDAEVTITHTNGIPTAVKAITTGTTWKVEGLTLIEGEKITVTAKVATKKISTPTGEIIVKAGISTTNTPTITDDTKITSDTNSLTGTCEENAEITTTITHTNGTTTVLKANTTGSTWKLDGLTLIEGEKITITAKTAVKKISIPTGEIIVKAGIATTNTPIVTDGTKVTTATNNLSGTCEKDAEITITVTHANGTKTIVKGITTETTWHAEGVTLVEGDKITITAKTTTKKISLPTVEILVKSAV